MKFVVSDESIVSYNGLRILINGINFSRFLQNPICLWNHERGNVIGKWKNLSKEGGKLIAELELDDSDSFSQSIKSKVEKGFINATSVGISVSDFKELPNEILVTTCELLEISLVDIPSNPNTVRKVPIQKGEVLKFYMSFKHNLKMDFITESKSLLGLAPETSEESVLAKIKDLLAKVQAGEQERLDEYFTQAIREKRVTWLEAENFKKIAKIDFESVKKIVDAKTPYVSAKSMIEAANERASEERGKRKAKGSQKDKSEWTLNEYRKFAPKELESNPALYERLLSEEK